MFYVVSALVIIVFVINFVTFGCQIVMGLSSLFKSSASHTDGIDLNHMAHEQAMRDHQMAHEQAVRDHQMAHDIAVNNFNDTCNQNFINDFNNSCMMDSMNMGGFGGFGMM